MWLSQVLSLPVRVGLGVMVMKEYSTLPRFSELEPQHQIKFSVIPRTFIFLSGVLPFYEGYSQFIQNTADRAKSK